MKPLAACRWLHNKAFFLDPAPPDPRNPKTYATPFWCAKTHTPVGPDGEGVGLDCCGPDRPCFRPEADL
jgi:hypothetical protein